jgi:hypothetical protein
MIRLAVAVAGVGHQYHRQVIPDDLFLEDIVDDPWNAPAGGRRANTEILDGLRRGQMRGVADLDAALALSQQLEWDFMAYGTGGGEVFNNTEVTLAIRALRATLGRLGIAFQVPFRDYSTFRTYWNANGAHGSWQARRDMVAGFIEPVLAQLFALQDRVEAGSSIVEPALSALTDAASIRDHLRRLVASVDADPRLAVSVAKDLVESTAKLILRERGEAYTDKEDLPPLVSRAQQALRLHAAGVPGDTDEAKALKTILASLTRLTQGVTELRNKVGVGHGRASVPEWVRPRHARLAAGAAGTWCNLMLETLADPDAPWRTDSSAS